MKYIERKTGMIKGVSMKKLLAMFVLLSLLSSVATAKDLLIKVGELQAEWRGGELSLSSSNLSNPFFQKAQIGQSGAKKDINDPIWGKGKALILKEKNGETCTVSLYKSSDFIFLQRTLVNNGGNEISVEKAPMINGEVALGLPADKLKTVSTAGLKPANKESGGYFYMTIADPATRRGIVGGWLTHERGSGIVFSSPDGNQPMLSARIDYGDLRIPAGKKVESELFVIGFFENIHDGLEGYADAIAKQLKIDLKEQPPVYCTWYHARASDEKKIISNTDFIAEKLSAYQPENFVVQIDDYWQAGVSSNGPKRDFTKVNPKGPYPSGMKKTADYIKGKGLIPGIWFIPFAGTWYDPYWVDKHDLFYKQGKSQYNTLKDKARKRALPEGPESEWPYEVAWGGTCLDMTNPKTQEYLRSMVGRIADDWGYKYFKMDGLWTGTGTRIQYINSSYRDDDLGQATRFNPSITPIEAYAKGLDIIREASGPDVFFLGCTVAQNMRSFGPAMGRVDAMRVGPDNGASPALLVRGPMFTSRVYFLNRRVWHNDPDPVYVRNSFPIEMAKSSVSWASLTGTLHASSIQYDELPPERLDILTRSMPSHSLTTARPVDYLEENVPQVWHLWDTRDNVRKDVVGLFNWNIESREIVSCKLDRIDLPKADKYVGFDFWSDRFIAPFSDEISIPITPGGCSIVSIRPLKNHPQVVSTSRHLTQGVVDLRAETWNAKTKSLFGSSSVIANEPYELRLVVPVGQSWNIDKIAMDGASGRATATYKQEGPTIRVTINSPETDIVSWQIKFTSAKVTVAKLEPVKDLTAEFSVNHFKLKWTSRPVVSYRLLRDGVLISEQSSGTFSDYDVEFGKKSYNYVLQAAAWGRDYVEVASIKATTPAAMIIPSVPPEPNIPIDSLKWLSAKSGHGQVRLDKPVSGKHFKINGKKYSKGIGTHAKSTIVYSIPERATHFVSTVGLDDKIKADARASVVFKLIGDVKEMGEPPVVIAQSPVLSGKNRIWHFNQKLDSRLKELSLVVDEAGDGISADHANWINPGFLK